MQRRFATLDVFTDRRFAGNPLAVVLDADGLDTAAMQAIAREFNHPETVFVLPPQDAGAPCAAAHLHAGAGTAVRRPSDRRHRGAARAAGRQRGRRRDGARGRRSGRCAARSRHDGGERGRVRFVIPQLPAEVGPAPDEATIAAALSLAPADIGFGRYRPSRWSAGNPFTFVPLTGLRRDGARVARSRDLRRGIRRRRRGRGGLSLLRRVRRARARFSRPHVRAEDGDHGGSGDRFGCRRLRGRARALRRPAGRRAYARASSRATRWDARA